MNRFLAIAVAACLYAVVQSSSLAAAHSVFELTGFKPSHWTIENGAPSGVFAVTQDSDGYLWVGSMDGTFRFDGIRFQHVPDAEGEHSQSQLATAFLPLRSGGMLIGYDWGGLSLWNRGTHRVLAKSGSFDHMAQGRGGSIWVARENNQSGTLMRFADRRWESLNSSQGLGAGLVHALVVATDGTVWTIKGSKIYYLLPGRRDFITLPGEASPFTKMAEGPDHAIWIADRSAVRAIRRSLTGTFAVSSPVYRFLKPLNDQQIVFDADGRLWDISPSLGIVKIDLMALSRGLPETRSIQIFDPDELEPVAGSAFRDREGNIWIGSKLGVVRFRPVSINRVELPDQAPATQWAPYAVSADASGTVFLKNHTAMYRVGGDEILQPLGARLRPYDNPCPAYPHGLWSRRASHDGDTLVDLASTDSPARSIAVPKSVALSPMMWRCTEDSHGRLWIPDTGAGLLRYDGTRWTVLRLDPAKAHVAPVSVIEAGKGVVVAYDWAGALYAIDGDKVSVLMPKDKITIGFIEAMYQGRSALYLLGETGMARITGGHVAVLSSGRFPVMRNLTGMLQTDRGITWLHGASGIAQIASNALDAAFNGSPRLPIAKLFSYADGLPGPGEITNYSSIVRDRQGRLWIATSGGIAELDPAHLRVNSLAPPVRIEGLFADGHPVRLASSLRLPVGSSRIRIEFTALSLSIPERVRFRYKLEGVDKDWTESEGMRSVSYAGLAPGHYRFEVRASNNDGVWSSSAASLAFYKPPTFLQSNLFKGLAAIVFLGIACLVYFARVRQIRTSLKRQHEATLDERERIARELHDTLLQGVQALILQVHVAVTKMRRGQADEAPLQTALDYANRVMIEARNRVLDLRASDPLSDLSIRINTVAKRALAGSDIKFRVIIKGQPRPLNQDAKSEIARIVDEAMHNIVRHAKASSVLMTLVFDPESFCISIADDGIGIDPDILAHGSPGHFGLLGMQERANRLSIRLKISNLIPCGAQVLLEGEARNIYASPSRRWWRRIRAAECAIFKHGHARIDV